MLDRDGLQPPPRLYGDEWSAPLFFLLLWIRWSRYFYEREREAPDWIDVGGEG